MTTGKRNYIAYSLWGNNPIYIQGMLKNIEQAGDIYPDWQVIIYHDDSVPAAVINTIKQTRALTVHINDTLYGMFWRFFAADIADCGHVIFRDSDSRLSLREKAAVDAWIDSNNAIHIMRDHPYHRDMIDGIQHHILGGMWGIKGNLINMRQLIDEQCAGKTLNYGSDQIFLNHIYDCFKASATIHDEFFEKSPFPVKRRGYRFVGERIDINEQPMGSDWKVIRDVYRRQNPWYRVLKTIKAAVSKIFK